MEILKNTFSQVQKICFSVIISCIVILIAMHNPLSGYLTTSDTYSVDIQLPECSTLDRENYSRTLTELYKDKTMRDKLIVENGDVDQLSKIIRRQVAACHLLAPGIPTDAAYNKELKKLSLDFEDWKTNDPMFEWMGKVVNLLTSLITVIFVGLLFGKVFNTKSV
jgi:hypothetical protein